MSNDDSPNAESTVESLSLGDEWPFHFRGYGLSINASGEVWWQAYNGTDRLALDPTPSDLVEDFLELKRNGGRIRVTEDGAVITKKEEGNGDEYETLYVGQLDLEGRLVPPADSSQEFEICPDGLNPGDLWPSVYDGSRYSFNGEQFWWHDPETKLRHLFAESLPRGISDELNRLRRNGGRFMITPQGDVITQIPTSKTPADIRAQFRDLPQPVKRVLQLRRDRGDVDMVPVYVGELPASSRPIEVVEPTRLTDPLSEQEAASLEAWVASMGSYDESDLSEDEHRFDDEEGL